MCWRKMRRWTSRSRYGMMTATRWRARHADGHQRPPADTCDSFASSRASDGAVTFTLMRPTATANDLSNQQLLPFTVFDLISEHALISGHSPFLFFPSNFCIIFYFYLFYFNINNYFKWLSWRQYKFTIYSPDGHTCPDVRLLGQNCKKDRGRPKKFVKRTVR